MPHRIGFDAHGLVAVGFFGACGQAQQAKATDQQTEGERESDVGHESC
jgi:hypothetical protein